MTVVSKTKSWTSKFLTKTIFSLARKARNFYNPPEITLCDICDGAEECVKDCEVPEINVVWVVTISNKTKNKNKFKVLFNTF